MCLPSLLNMNNVAKFDPNEGIYYEEFPRHLVEAIDKLLEFKIKMNVPDSIGPKDETGWLLVRKVFDLWAICYPEHSKKFIEYMREKRKNLINDTGASIREKGGAQIRAITEVPQKLDQLLHIFLPQQKWTKECQFKMAKILPEVAAFNKK